MLYPQRSKQPFPTPPSFDPPLSVPFALWHLMARIPGTPITRNQVELMETDTVASVEMPGFDAFGIAPQPIANTLEKILAAA